MGKHSFFVLYQDDEEHTEVVNHAEEKLMVKDILRQYEASKKVPHMVIRGEVLKVSISTRVLFEVEDEK